MSANYWSQHTLAHVCNWPVLRDGREQRCGERVARKGARCLEHEDQRSVIERCLDPLGPYVAEVRKIQIARMKEKQA